MLHGNLINLVILNKCPLHPEPNSQMKPLHTHRWWWPDSSLVTMAANFDDLLKHLSKDHHISNQIVFLSFLCGSDRNINWPAYFCQSSDARWLLREAKKRKVHLKREGLSLVIGRKKNSPKSNPLNYSTLESYPQASVPLANQSQQIAAVNISDSADLNKDIGSISPLRGALESFWRPSASANMNSSTADFSAVGFGSGGGWGVGGGKQTEAPSVTALS